MTLIKSISGIRGTIGGTEGESFTPIDICKFTAAYSQWLKTQNNKTKQTVVVGRDARISGPIVRDLVCSTLISMGNDVIDLGLATTPTTEMAVMLEKADGGIIITASHNPRNWNALKLLNNKGEFISAEDGDKILKFAENNDYTFADVDNLGHLYYIEAYDFFHIQEILKLELVNTDAIRKANFKIAIDCVNSVGGIAIPKLLNALGIDNVIELYCTPNGEFPHNPEPLPENINDISNLIKREGADLGFVVDPDVDRLAIVCEDGSMFGEEYTLVAIADYILQKEKGNTVSNLSSSRALRDITLKHRGNYFASAVGEVNVVQMMKEKNAVIGGEGNGGIIYPKLHYGRDALVGIALFLSYLAEKQCIVSEIRGSLPKYVMSKNKIELTPDIDVDNVLNEMAKKYSHENIST
ncbi:MAG: phosphoglucosamine mutase, partial [Bacteroidales bacterium]|nr:phosphoglucosamine mutase [Bacteroidales bacterium]